MRFINKTSDLSKYLGIRIENQALIKKISTDTRTIKKGSLFIAIRGKNFNGNDYVKDAFKKGAVLALVDDLRFKDSKNKKIIYVKNTIKSLTKIGKNIIKDFEGKVIAITGSNGKTSTTSIVADSLRKVSTTIENFNNEIGVPLSLINASPKSDYLVLEIGASKFNDIDHLSKILKPDIGIITNIGNSHLEELKNTNGVLRVKSEIITHIKKNGFLVVPNDNEKHLSFWKKVRKDINIVTFGKSKSADFYSYKADLNSDGANFYISSKNLVDSIKIKTTLEGEHNIMNILASCACHFCLNQDLDLFAKKINLNKLTIKRQRKTKWLNGSTLIDDTYNANPDSTKKSIDLLCNYNNKKKILILGDMLELGKFTKNLHKEIGIYAKQKGIDNFLGFGNLTKVAVDAFGKNGFFFNGEKDLKAYIKDNISSKDIILIKGSRGMKMERFIDV